MRNLTARVHASLGHLRSLLRHRIIQAVFVPVILVLIGTVGYHDLEGWTWFESLYATVITLSTIGYGDYVPKTTAGQAFTIVLVLVGVFTLFYVAAALIRALVSGELQNIVGRQLMERSLARLKDHLIVCGYGRMGRLVCKEFSARSLPFVIVDLDATHLEDFELPHGIALHGDATSDEVLRRAGIDRARALVTVMASDADNLYTTLSARLLNEKLFIVARVEEAQAEQKLLRAGANRVVSPYQIGGERVAQAVLRPTVVDFIELATQAEHFELQIEETRIGATSPLANTTLQDSRLRAELKVIIVAIKRASGKMIYNPDPDLRIEVGDILVAIGRRENLDQLDVLANR
jgi:voltage-gated potassium channel